MTGTRTGKAAKDSLYLKRIKDAIEGDNGHPRHKGIAMQAHHVISGEGMKRSGLGSLVESYGYDINLLENLAFIPCTLQGACYLGIQPHRGNHSFVKQLIKLGEPGTDHQENYYDTGEPGDYHDKVAIQLQRTMDKHAKKCTGDDDKDADDAIRRLNKLSKSILSGIERAPDEFPLTAIAEHFGPDGVGCGGVDSVTKHKAPRAKCPVGRNHLTDPTGKRAAQGKGQKKENILYDNASKYRLKFELKEILK